MLAAAAAPHAHAAALDASARLQRCAITRSRSSRNLASSVASLITSRAWCSAAAARRRQSASSRSRATAASAKPSASPWTSSTVSPAAAPASAARAAARRVVRRPDDGRVEVGDAARRLRRRHHRDAVAEGGDHLRRHAGAVRARRDEEARAGEEGGERLVVDGMHERDHPVVDGLRRQRRRVHHRQAARLLRKRARPPPARRRRPRRRRRRRRRRPRRRLPAALLPPGAAPRRKRWVPAQRARGRRRASHGCSPAPCAHAPSNPIRRSAAVPSRPPRSR